MSSHQTESSPHAATGAGWELHTVLKVTTQEDSNALHALLPYLAMGYAMVQTDGTANHSTAINAMRKSYNAALKGLFLRDGVTSDWRTYFNSKNYDRIVKAHVEREGLSDHVAEERIAQLKYLSRSRELSSVQMGLLLDTVNDIEHEILQLGIIREGFMGRYDEITKSFDADYVHPTELVLPGGRLRNRPVFWIYETNEDKKNIAHRKITTPSLNRFEAIMPLMPGQPQYEGRKDRIEKLCVGVRLDALLEIGVWKLWKTDIGTYAGTFVRRGNNPETRQGHLFVSAPTGNSGFVANPMLRDIHPVSSIPTARTDATWRQWAQQYRPQNQAEKEAAGARKRNLRMFLEDEKEEEEEEPDVVEDFTRIRLCRVIPATSRTGHFLDENNLVMNIDGYNSGAVVLDTGRRARKDGTGIARIVRVNGQVDVIWQRCLQPLEYPFGLADRLPPMEPFTKIPDQTPLKDLRIMYKKIHGKEPPFKRDKTRLTREQLNDEEPEKRVLLRAFAIRKDSSASKSYSEVDFVTGEYVLRERQVRDSHLVRDHEGIAGSLSDRDLTRVQGTAAGAWNLCLSERKLRRSGLFLPAKVKPPRTASRRP